MSADPERLQQVVWNLLSNAAKFSDAGSKVSVAIDSQDDHYVLAVRDTGRGIDPAFLRAEYAARAHAARAAPRRA